MGRNENRVCRDFFVRFFRRYYYEKKCGVSKAERGVGGYDEGSRFDWRRWGGAVTSRSHNRPCRSVMAAVYQVLCVCTWTLLDIWLALTRSDRTAMSVDAYVKYGWVVTVDLTFIWSYIKIIFLYLYSILAMFQVL